MKLKLTIDAPNSKILLQEIKDILSLVELELECDECKGCKPKSCKISGGSSELGLDSSWTLTRRRSLGRKIQENC